MISVDELEDDVIDGFAKRTELPREVPLRARLEDEDDNDEVVAVVVVVKDSLLLSLNMPV